MAEGKGYSAILKLAVPPQADYHSGASLIVQGDTLDDVAALVGLFVDEPEVGKTIVRQIVEFNLKGSVTAALQADAPAAEARPVVTGSKPVPQATEPDPNGPASAGLMSVVAKKTGKTVDELGELTTEQAKALLKEAKA